MRLALHAVPRILATLVLLAGCGSSQATGGSSTATGTGGGRGAGGSRSTTTGTATGGAGGASPGSDGGLLFDAGVTDGGDDCSAAAKLVYVVTIDMQLYSFDPMTRTFAKVGTVTCGSETSAWSMGVDRSGTAWMLFASGKLYNVSTADASCTPTAYVPGTTSFAHFGMGFVSDAPGSTSETLFVSDSNNGVLGKVDTQTLTLTPIATYSPALGGSELTGTGDARLFGFWPHSPVVVAQIDKTTAAVMSQTPLPGVTIGGGYAFAFWGGDFWLFSANNVYHYVPGSGTAPSVATYPFVVVGAGVSTCAPVVPPQ